MPPLTHPNYRSDIDGLRAIAIFSVIAFHAFPDWVSGGFIGVDVFFVISGFLISTIIFDNLDKGSFRFAEFYTRRIRRIFPALFLVLAVSLLFGWFALLADEYRQLGKHSAGAVGFVLNIVLWKEAGYFDNSAATKPLLHLWSLSVEEQFYIVWPLLAWLAWKRKFNLFALTLLAAVVSFALNIMTVSQDSAAAFYSPQTRFWEILIGSVLAWIRLYKRHLLPSGRIADTLSVVGALLLAYGFWRIDKQVDFPGFWVLLPVAGAAMLIAAGNSAWVNRAILSHRTAVWFGLISYPLYLWHWPLLSFAHILESETPSREIRVSAILISILLAWLTYRFVEQPIRSHAPDKIKTATLAALMAIAGCSGYYVYSQNGLPSRGAVKEIAHTQRQMELFSEDDPHLHDNCMKNYNLADPIRYCNFTGGKPEIALIGDSHARAIYDEMALLLQARGDGVLNIGGRLLLGVATYPKGNKQEEDVYKGGIRATQFAADEPSIKTVVMLSRTHKYIDDEDPNRIFQLIHRPDIKDRKKVFEIGMRKTLDAFAKKNKRVIFVIDNPEIDFDPRSCLKDRPLRITDHVREPCAIPRSEYDAQSAYYRKKMFAILKDYPNVRIFDSPAYLCDEQWCWAAKDGEVLYRDNHHLSSAGSMMISKELIKVIDGADSKRLP